MTTRSCSSQPPHDILADLRRKGLRLTEEQGRLKVAPKSALTPELRITLSTHKPALLQALSTQDQILRMSLRDFEKAGRPMEVKVPCLDATIWFVPGPTEMDALVRRGIGRGRIWTASELRVLWCHGSASHQDTQSVVSVKVAFGGEVVSVEQLSGIQESKDGADA